MKGQRLDWIHWGYGFITHPKVQAEGRGSSHLPEDLGVPSALWSFSEVSAVADLISRGREVIPGEWGRDRTWEPAGISLGLCAAGVLTGAGVCTEEGGEMTKKKEGRRTQKGKKRKETEKEKSGGGGRERWERGSRGRSGGSAWRRYAVPSSWKRRCYLGDDKSPASPPATAGLEPAACRRLPGLITANYFPF